MFVYLAMIDAPDDQATFERVYQKYRYLMLHVAYKILQNHQDAEDAVHQAFISIIENLDKIFEVNSPETSCQGLFNQIHKKATKKPQKKCQKQILAPDTFADGLFSPA